LRFKTGFLAFLFVMVIQTQIMALEPVPHPNPWRYGINNSANGGMDFNIRTDATAVSLKIYTLSGDLVRNIKVTDLSLISGGTLTWDGRNENGWSVSGGVYFFYLEVTYPGTSGSQSEKFKGKIILIN